MFQRKRLVNMRFLILLAILGGLAYVKWHPSWEPSSESLATTPTDVKALRSLQERIEAVVQKVAPAVVAVEFAGATSASSESSPPVFQCFCSGVIITADGLVLSQFHVSHRYPWDGKGPIRSRQPGERTTVILSDGRKLEAELLGANQTFDLSLLRLLDSGPHPHVPLDYAVSVKLGDWVLKLGHPLGYRCDRPPVVRLGRVLFQQKGMFVTDCLITGGDSGGPFFDLDGRLIGIVESNSVPAKLLNTLSTADRIGPFGGMTSRFVRQHFDAMLRCEIASFDKKACDSFLEGYRRAKNILPRPQWTQGAATAEAFHPVVRESVGSVASILDENDHHVTFGTVVASDGWIMTLASILPTHPKCQLSAARVVSAEVVGMSPAFDLALLKIPAADLPTVKWADRPPMVAGTILAAVGAADAPLGIGVVSVPQRDLPGPFPTCVTPPKIHAAPPNLSGRATDKGYLVNAVFGTMADADIQPGDVLISIADRGIHDDQDVFKCVEGHLASQRVPVRIMRRGEEKESTIQLDGESLTDSKPYADYPTLFEHDIPLSVSQCGGPVVDLDGNAVGITLWRGRYGCMAIPAACVKQLMADLKSQQSHH